MTAQAVPSKPLKLSQLSPEEEDTLIHARITNDERSLRRLTKKFHSYASIAYPPIVETASAATSSVEEAREAFLIELASFQLLLRKNRMACNAERRQVDVYEQESARIENERTSLKQEIEELKLTLEQAQLERRRKIEYDQIAEKINGLPTRDELELSISSLENDIQVTKDEHETLNRSILARKAALDAIIADIGRLSVLGKDVPKLDATTSRAPSEPPDAEPETSALGLDADASGPAAAVEGEGDKSDDASMKRSASLNPAAKSYSPRPSTPLLQTATQQLRVQNSMSGISATGLTPAVSRDATPVFTPVGGPDSSPLSPAEEPQSPPGDDKREEGEENEEGEEAEDIEMGEVSEEKAGVRGRKTDEDREEGEASDESSVLSDPPDE
ncbi:uncharacterized protein FOMMEDRAFT_164577 [Fomitiporia mediterranea MF3/22]|uniref:uncharacterized protein n=1 Tax=Fomitiporia mediterranea (strain MF3/22) TaxID=694068 RepID=UPI00044088A2|nr:uncharacterized protein FOMMEDRAFT_164577 [Fomitiporia mediterranea MF3/22]EJD07668.1 hypothetical protein FOMMEDRAFT_164577 [Fomitiporia mediterranea MF3/22]